MARKSDSNARTMTYYTARGRQPPKKSGHGHMTQSSVIYYGCARHVSPVFGAIRKEPLEKPRETDHSSLVSKGAADQCGSAARTLRLAHTPSVASYTLEGRSSIFGSRSSTVARMSSTSSPETPGRQIASQALAQGNRVHETGQPSPSVRKAATGLKISVRKFWLKNRAANAF
jgi:hypothetical protein